jgi:hypothetical protein
MPLPVLPSSPVDRAPAARPARPHLASRPAPRPDAARPGIEAARALRDIGMSDERILASFVTAGMSAASAAMMLRTLRHADGAPRSRRSRVWRRCPRR